MDGLRWLLLFLGILVIAGVYLYSRRERTRAESDSTEPRRITPTLGDDAEELTEAEATSRPEVEDDLDMPSEGVPQKIVTLRLIARNGGSFAGDDLILGLRGIGLRHQPGGAGLVRPGQCQGAGDSRD